MKVDELTRAIEESSGLSIDELPRVTGFSWFQGADSKVVTIVLGQPFPLKDGAVAYAIFQNDEVVRVYTLSRDRAKPSPPSRYTLTKAAPTFVAEVMSLETFVDEIAEEWQIVAGLDDLEDDDDDDDDKVEKPADSAAVSSDTVVAATLTP